MRIAVLTVLLLLAAGCSLTKDGEPHPVPGAAAAPPSRGAALSDVDAWVRSGAPVDPARFGTATTRDGKVTSLNGDIAFVDETGKIKCTTDFHSGFKDLSCLVDLKNPPPRPPGEQIGNWVGGWIDYSGPTLSVGSLHGDPGPFIRGNGPTLPYGSRITAGDFTCRLEPGALVCLHESAKSAVRISDAGVIPFGCLHEQADPKSYVGQAFTC
ncbi:hypothetical protein [Nocardia blacklockiae]|uniref:hypothetical protein n=1 Tax=Nocardia blacklockiae TaxID=480036 RepID=UPI0018949982|nr:hypothetical protein [Nocardia blacklockiae]MBF6174809.1 hypothetical protein [Nocardia blacklockiae]